MPHVNGVIWWKSSGYVVPRNCAAGHFSENYNPRLKRKRGGGTFTKLIKKGADFGNASWGLGSSERRLWLFGNRSGGFPAGTQPVLSSPEMHAWHWNSDLHRDCVAAPNSTDTAVKVLLVGIMMQVMRIMSELQWNQNLERMWWEIQMFWE